MRNQAKQQAVKDTKETLKEQAKCFIMFNPDLDKAINDILAKYLSEQKGISNGKV